MRLPSKLGYQISSGSDRLRRSNNASLKCVTAVGDPFGAVVVTTFTSPRTSGVEMIAASVDPSRAAVNDITSCGPSVIDSTAAVSALIRLMFALPRSDATTSSDRSSGVQKMAFDPDPRGDG